MTTLALDLPEVNSAPAENLDPEFWSDDHADAMAEEAALDDAWGRSCEVGYLLA